MYTDLSLPCLPLPESSFAWNQSRSPSSAPLHLRADRQSRRSHLHLRLRKCRCQQGLLFQKGRHFEQFGNLLAAQYDRQLLWSLHARQVVHFIALFQNGLVQKYNRRTRAAAIAAETVPLDASLTIYARICSLLASSAAMLFCASQAK